MKVNVNGVNLVKAVFFTGVFFLPLVFWSTAYIAFEIPKVWFFSRWVEVLAVLTLIFFHFFRPKKVDPLLFVLILGFLFSAIFSSLFGAEFTKSVFGNYYRMDGLLTLFHLVGFSMILFLIWDKSFESLTAIAISLSNFVLFVWILINPFFNRWPDGGVGLTFGNPNFLAGYLVCTLPFVVYLINRVSLNRYKFVWVFLFCFQLISIFLTKSVGGYLGAGFFFLMLLIDYIYGRKKKFKIAAAVILVVFLFVSFFVFKNIWIFEHSKVYVPEARSRVLPKIFLGAMQRPIFGWGVSNVDRAFEEVPFPIPVQFDIYVDKAHSIFLEIFATQGIFGLIIYLMLIFRAIQLLRKKAESKTFLFIFLLFIFHSQTNIISINEEMLFWMVVGGLWN